MSPVIFELFGFEIRWYSILILTGILVAYLLIHFESRKFLIKKEFLFNLMFWALIFGIIGARLYYVIFNFDYYKDNLIEIVEVWNGGLAIHGGILFGLITIIVYCKKYKVNTWKILDIIAPAVIIAQAIGRWGNFFNQEAHGAATTYAKLKDMHIPEFIINNMNIGGIYYTPTFLYESIWCLLGFIVLLIARKFKYLKVGQLTSIYLMWYSVGRFVIEASRTDSLMLGGFKVAQLVSVLLFLIGLFAFMILSRRSKFENLYSESNADQIRF